MMKLRRLDPRRLLGIPNVYDSYQKMLGTQQGRLDFIRQTIAPRVKSRVLEVGCGTGINCEGFSDQIAYVGCDVSDKYINHAKETYGNRADFYAKSVGNLRHLHLEPFDVVIALAVLHHLSDDEIMNLCDEVKELLAPGGIFITADPCFTKAQPWYSNFATSFDRGQYVRTPSEYTSLLERKFLNVETQMHNGKLLVIPHAGFIMFAAN